MRLLIISDMPHHLRQNEIVGWGPTVVEIDHLAQLFQHIDHLGFLYSDPPPANSRAYDSERVHFLALKPSGGRRWYHKVGIVWQFPGYFFSMWKQAAHAQVIHVRAPANVSLLAMLWLAFSRKKVWIKYAGNWAPAISSGHREPVSYALQRWWLRIMARRNLVTVNGSWPKQPGHIRSFFNPSLSSQVLATAAQFATHKKLGDRLKLLFVGRIERPKGTDTALRIVAKLVEAGIPVHLDLLGDSEERSVYEQQAGALGISNNTSFHGWLPHDRLVSFYQAAHILLLPTRTEGWPKVLSEGLAHGVVPVAGAVGAIPQYLATFAIGRACAPEDDDAFQQAIADYWQQPEQWQRESARGPVAAEHFTYDHYLGEVRKLLAL